MTSNDSHKKLITLFRVAKEGHGEGACLARDYPVTGTSKQFDKDYANNLSSLQLNQLRFIGDYESGRALKKSILMRRFMFTF